MAQRVAQLPALVDRTGALGRGMAWYPARKGELSEEPAEPLLVPADVGVDLAVRALKVGVSHDSRSAVPGSGNIDHVEVILRDDPVKVGVDEVLPGGRAPMPQKHVL